MKKEQLAEHAHDVWSGWMKYMFEKSKINDDGTITIPKWAVERWTRQSNTKYSELPEDEKKSDRDEADKMIKIFKDESGKYIIMEKLFGSWKEDGNDDRDLEELYKEREI